MSRSFRRLLGYALGFALFYAPFACFEKAVIFCLGGDWESATIHTLCLRIQIGQLASGDVFRMGTASAIFLLALVMTAVFFGPVFCGRLCPAGAFAEYSSYLVPDRYQINWRRHVDIAAVRYGFLAGYMVAPLFHFALACAYCNFYLFDLLVNYFLFGYFIALSSSQILTVILGFGLFSLFTRGGRGYCLFLCPVGAVQNLLHSFSRRWPFVYKMKVDAVVCRACGRCATACSMQAVTVQDGAAVIDPALCFACGNCQAVCPAKAINYGR